MKFDWLMWCAYCSTYSSWLTGITQVHTVEIAWKLVFIETASEIPCVACVFSWAKWQLCNPCHVRSSDWFCARFGLQMKSFSSCSVVPVLLVSLLSACCSANVLLFESSNDVICPGGGAVCEGPSSTCCRGQSGEWSCCPFKDVSIAEFIYNVTRHDGSICKKEETDSVKSYGKVGRWDNLTCSH